jgi:hypothetical protein
VSVLAKLVRRHGSRVEPSRRTWRHGTEQLWLLSPAVLDHAASDVAEDDGETAEDCDEDQCLTPATATLAAAAGTFEHADAGSEVAFFRKEVVGGDRRSRLNRWRSGDGVAR